MADYDVIIVGSGINSLVCAALLAKRGAKVCLLERNDVLGGAIRTERPIDPRYSHDMMCCWYPLFVTSLGYGELKADLDAAGVKFATAPIPTATLTPFSQPVFLRQGRAETVAELDRHRAGDGEAYARSMAALERDLDLTFALLGSELWSGQTALRLAKEALRRGPGDLMAYFGEAFETCRSWSERTFSSKAPSALLAPWVLHTGLGPDAALSGLMARVIAFTLEQVGMPVVVGGGSELVRAFEGLLRRWGATVRTSCEVVEVLVENGVARGVVTSKGEAIIADRAVVCNVAPSQLYGRLVPREKLPANVWDRAQRYRYGRAAMQIHVALSAPAPWRVEALRDTAMVHLTSGQDAVSRAVAEADSGYLPREATIVVGQPCAADPSRAPDGAASLWIQLQELPRRIGGDAAGEIEAPNDGAWTASIAEFYADRIMQRIEREAPGLSGTILGRTVLSPKDLERLNPNLVGGDPYCGDCSIQQFGPWRPLSRPNGHRTAIRRLWHIGAATHPGPGLGGGSGYLTAKALS